MKANERMIRDPTEVVPDNAMEQGRRYLRRDVLAAAVPTLDAVLGRTLRPAADHSAQSPKAAVQRLSAPG